MTLHAIYHFKIPAHVPLDGTIAFSDLATATGLDEDRLTRILRYAMLNHIFTEPTPGQVAHSAVSRLLTPGTNDIDFLGHSTEDVWPGCLAQVQALKNKIPSQASPDSGVMVALGGGNKNTLFEVFEAEPARVKRFGNAMAATNAPGGFASVDKLLMGFDWQSLGKAKVVDVGGSLGATAIAVLQSAKQLTKVIVQDLPEVIEEATSRPVPLGLEDRLEFQKASFLEPQPIKDADLYYFRFIFHDWPTDKCIEILKNLVPSMKRGSRLLMNDFFLYPNDAIHDADVSYSRVARAADLQMMVAFNARERSLRELEEMVESAVPGELILESSRELVVVFRKL